jgi:hypothetical protein
VMPDPSAFEQFIVQNPSVVAWVWGGLASFIAALGGIVMYFVRSTMNGLEVGARSLRENFTALAAQEARDIIVLREALLMQDRALGERLDQLSKIMLDQWERFHAEMQAQGSRLSRLEGEHSVLHSLRRREDAAKVNAENGGGD